MPDAAITQIHKNYYLDAPQDLRGFHVKGASNLDWGAKDRLSRIFNPKSASTLMLAFDHGYLMGSTAGLERLDIVIPSLAPYIDVFMATRGALRACVPPGFNKAVALRVSAGSTVAVDDVTHEFLGVNIEDAIRLNASCIAVQTFVGVQDEEKKSLKNLSCAVNAGNRYGIPVLGVVAVGKQMARDTKFFLLATRVLAELGASIVKTYYCEDFEKVTAACPVPIVMAGGKKMSEQEALALVYKAMQSGAAGVDMGRNIFQAQNPAAMAQAIGKTVHEKLTGEQAFEFYTEACSR